MVPKRMKYTPTSESLISRYEVRLEIFECSYQFMNT